MPSTENVEMITPSQSRAARALIEWTQPRLAEASNLGLSTVVDFEKSRRQISDDSARAIQAALESAGVIFVAENGEGPGVRLRKQPALKR
ncbi:helix-turn-helix transcriptional regulator [Mesorhizobium sp. LNJC394B00]|uniref:helix-turn-helix transcriptional regulator n=1 Tax=Mesorhizobium sp. LNJC394B00 TaxID=1287274 RepID=UPI0004CF9D4E|nr:helix-turn-helix transcriptional regulator [Mesorhizobium sp. LNJC394B00]